MRPRSRRLRRRLVGGSTRRTSYGSFPRTRRPTARYFRQASTPAVAGWYREVARSGGVIMDLMVHDLDQARWTCGEVVSVYAVQNPPTVDGISPVNVAAHVTLTHATGAISHCRATWGATGTRFQSGFT